MNFSTTGADLLLHVVLQYVSREEKISPLNTRVLGK